MKDYEYQKLRSIKRKMYLIDLRGGCCERCGYKGNMTAFEFHHKDSTQKEFQLDARHLSNSTMKSILKEFSKCELLCSNCHREIHNPELNMENVNKIIERIDNNNILKEYNKPECVDCGIIINYGSTRCKKCSDINRRRVNRPEKDLLKRELKENGVTWCSNKYSVSRATIHRWLK